MTSEDDGMVCDMLDGALPVMWYTEKVLLLAQTKCITEKKYNISWIQFLLSHRYKSIEYVFW